MSHDGAPHVVSLLSCPADDGQPGTHGFPGGGEVCVCGRQGVWRDGQLPAGSNLAVALAKLLAARPDRRA